jgi:hypothetical protein
MRLRVQRAAYLLSILFCLGFCSVINAANARAQETRGATLACEPRVRMKTLLDNVRVGGNGHLSLGSFYAMCLPEPARRSATNYAYNPYDGGKLSSVLKTSGGQTLNTYVWYAEKIAGLWELSRYEVVGGPKAVKPLTAGTYVLEFAIEDKPFQRLSLSTSTVESKDVYRPETIHLLDGPWSDYAELYFPKPDRYTQLWVWLRDKESAGARPKEIQYVLKLVRESDGKIIADGGGATSAMILKPHWGGYKLSFRPTTPQPDGSSEFHASEFLKTDGKYRIDLSLDGKPYGSYSFTVKGGKLSRDDAQTREAARAMMPLESDVNYFSLKRATR